MWVFFDDRNLYLAFRCLDSQPEREVVTEMRRDDNGVANNDSISVVLDTFLRSTQRLLFPDEPARHDP
jgi:hypothetical protein